MAHRENVYRDRPMIEIGFTPKPMVKRPMAAKEFDHRIILLRCATSAGPCSASNRFPRLRMSREKDSKSNVGNHSSSFPNVVSEGDVEEEEDDVSFWFGMSRREDMLWLWLLFWT
jgi:hypothetical protein